MGAALLACSLGGCSAGNGSGGPGEGGGSSACAYPKGPYGTSVGAVVDPTLSWQGYRDDGTTATTVAMTDYYDCDGSRGVDALLVDEAAQWCSDCASQEVTIGPDIGSTWKSQGVHVVTLLAQDTEENPATLATALSWRNEYALTTGAVCADPSWTTKLWGGASSSGNGFPTSVVIDPRTMKIVAIQPKDVPTTVTSLAAANGG
ncbi:MAG TPA: hypothetical protein VIY73_25770 [Polyangiaceae bacterium]